MSMHIPLPPHYQQATASYRKLLNQSTSDGSKRRVKEDPSSFPDRFPLSEDFDDDSGTEKPKIEEESYLKALGGVFPCEADNKYVESSSIERCWSTSIDIQFAYEKYAIIGINGGCVSFGGCKVIIPKNGLKSTYEFKFTLFYGKSPDELVLTPALHCVPAIKIRKPIIVQLPTCYVLEEDISVRPQFSQNGKTWKAGSTSLEKPLSGQHRAITNQLPTRSSDIDNGGPPPITFALQSLSWFRVDSADIKQFHSLFKRMVLILYIHPNVISFPTYTWELRDAVIDANDLLNERECVRNHITIRSGEDLEVVFCHPNAKVKPLKTNIKSKDVFEQGFCLREKFLILKEDALELSGCKCTITFVSRNNNVRVMNIDFLCDIFPVEPPVSRIGRVFETVERRRRRRRRRTILELVRNLLGF